MHTDHLDVLQFHISPSRQTLEQDGALETVLELKRAGTIRFIGMSGTLPHIVDHIAMGVFDVFQIPYSAVEREHEAIIAAAARRPAPASSFVAARPRARPPRASKRACNGIGGRRWSLRDLLDGMTPMEFILRFTFTHPDLHTNIVGTINPGHLQHNVDVLRQGPLRADVYAEAKRRLEAAGSAPRGH